jgi:hypothetical protein
VLAAAPAEAPASAGTAAAPVAPRGRPPWVVALVAFAVLGSAYLGAYLLLTAQARRAHADLVAAWPETATARDPGPPPAGDDARAVATWRLAKEAWDKRTQAETLERRVSTIRNALFAALGLQTAITALLLARSMRSRRPPPDARARRS